MPYAAHFFGGVFAANALPHLIAGITGKRMQTPFASPPFRGLSSAIVNVAWSLVNIALAFLMLVVIAPLALTDWRDAASAFAGFGAMALFCARSFTKLRRQKADQD